MLCTLFARAVPSCFRHALRGSVVPETSPDLLPAPHVKQHTRYHRAAVCFPKLLSVPATLGMSRNSPSPLLYHGRVLQPPHIPLSATGGCRGFSLAVVFGPSCRRALLQHRLSWASTMGKQRPARSGSEPFQPRFLFRCFHFLRVKCC